MVKKFCCYFYFAIAFCVLFMFGSCSDFSIPESVSIKTAPASYDFRLGKLETDSLFKTDKFLEKLQGSGEKYKVYDFDPGADSDKISFLMEYKMLEIPVDFGKYLDKLSLNKKINNSAAQKLRIPNVDTPSLSVPVEVSINSLVASNLGTISIPVVPVSSVLGSCPDIELPLSTSEISFSSITYKPGSHLKLKLSNPTPLGDGTVTIRITSNEVVVASDTQAVSSEMIFDFDVSGETLGNKVTFGFNVEGCTIPSLFTANSLDFSATYINSIAGLNMEESASTRVSVDKKISIASMANGLRSTKVSSGFMELDFVMPGSSGININLAGLSIGGDLRNSSGVPFTGSDFAAVSGYKKNLDLNGAQIIVSSDKEIVVNGDVGVSFDNATISVNSDGKFAMTLKCDTKISSFIDSKINLNKFIPVSTLAKDIDEPLGDDIKRYVDTITFSKMNIETSFAGTNIPENDLLLSEMIVSEAFALPPTFKGEVNPKSGNTLLLEANSDKAWNASTYTMPRRANNIERIDFSPEVKLMVDYEGSVVEVDDDHPVTFSGEIVLGKEYDFQMEISIEYAWEAVSLSELKGHDNGKVVTGIDLNEIFEKALDNIDMSHVSFKKFDPVLNEGILGHVVASVPATSSASFSQMEIKATVCDEKAAGDAGEFTKTYLIGNETEGGLVPLKKEIMLDEYLIDNPRSKEGAKYITETREDLFEGKTSVDMMNFADVLNKRSKDLTLTYDIDFGSGSGSYYVTKDDLENSSTTISFQLIVDLPFILEAENYLDSESKLQPGVKIPNALSIGGSTGVSDDMLNRDSADKFEELRKYTKAVEAVGLKYNASRSMDNFFMTFMACKTQDGNDDYWEKDGAAGNKIALKKAFPFGGFLEKSVLFNQDEIDFLFYEAYPAYPKIGMVVGVDEDGNVKPAGEKTVFAFPRNTNINVNIHIKMMDGVTISIMD